MAPGTACTETKRDGFSLPDCRTEQHLRIETGLPRHGYTYLMVEPSSGHVMELPRPNGPGYQRAQILGAQVSGRPSTEEEVAVIPLSPRRPDLIAWNTIIRDRPLVLLDSRQNLQVTFPVKHLWVEDAQIF
ncbi:hypothetical protein KY386_03825 [Candidatus Parcubacteria bacterium]|nr:hypothetical protein [Candidatus Parcubacteria bacterium]